MKLEKKLLQEVARYRSINRYVVEQATPAPAPSDPSTAPEEDAAAPAAGALPPPASSDSGTAPGMDNGTPPPPGDSPASAAPMSDSPQPEVEQVDVSDLVQMTQELKTKLDAESNKNQDAVHKMDAVFSKLDDLANQLSQMDQLLSKIDDLERKVSETKPLTPQEKLFNRAKFDSYPFNQRLTDFFNEKEPELKAARKEYTLTQDDVDGYSKEDVNKSFEDF
jgi:hypothetical protein